MIDKLEMFIALARARHFGHAAEECGVTQPTLSAAIKQLEEHLGVILVRRGSRFQGLTPEGQRVLDWARRIVGDSRAMRDEMRAVKHGLSGHLRIAAIPTALTMVPELTTPFSEAHPKISFAVHSRTSIEILSLIENLEADAGITYLENEPLGRVTTVPLFLERYHFVTAKIDALVGRSSISWKEASVQPLCLLTEDMQNRRIINQHLIEAGANVSPTLESDSMIALASHVRTGKWSSIMPTRMAESYAAWGGLKAIPIVEPDVAHMVGLVVGYREPFTPVIAALLQQAKSISSLLP